MMLSLSISEVDMARVLEFGQEIAEKTLTQAESAICVGAELGNTSPTRVHQGYLSLFVVTHDLFTSKQAKVSTGNLGDRLPDDL